MLSTDFSSYPDKATLFASVSDVQTPGTEPSQGGASYADVQTPGTEPSQGISGASDSVIIDTINLHDFEIRVPYLDINLIP